MTGPITWHPFEIRFVTPAFLGQDPEGPTHVDDGTPFFPFPVASLRGALRYWLRALVGAHVGNDLEALRRVEERVYGAAAGDSGTPSRVLLRCRQPVRRANTTDKSWLGSPVSAEDLPPIGYLLGPGLWDSRRPRAALRAVTPDTRIQFAVRAVGETPAALFLASLWALRTFGGLGARVRRGFGTFQLVNVPELGVDTPWLSRDDPEDLTAVLALVRDHIVGDVRPGDARPSYPRFDTEGESHKTRSCWLFRDTSADLDPPATDAGSALAACGRLWQTHRTDMSREDNLYSQLVKPYLDEGRAEGQFALGAYGLPVPFSDPNPDGKGRRSAIIEPRLDGKPIRRASPIWLRVRPEGAAWQLRTLVFFADWLPVKACLRIRDTTSPKVNGHQRKPPRPLNLLNNGTVDSMLDSWLDAVTVHINPVSPR